MKTKNDILNKMIENVQYCKFCNQKMEIWECPPLNVADGSGWGSPYLHVCFNDECPNFIKGFEDLKKYGRKAVSHRYYIDPTGTSNGFMMSSKGGGNASIVNLNLKKELEKVKKAVESKDITTLFDMLFTHPIYSIVAEIIDHLEEIGTLSMVEPLLAHKFETETLKIKVKQVVEKIYSRFSVQECPYCAEIINDEEICHLCGKPLKNKEAVLTADEILLNIKEQIHQLEEPRFIRIRIEECEVLFSDKKLEYLDKNYPCRIFGLPFVNIIIGETEVCE